MKKSLFILVFLTGITFISSAQSKGDETSLIPLSSSISKFYTIDELTGMSKGELTKLYILRLDLLLDYAPFMAITHKSGQKMSDIGIPESSTNTDKLEKLNKSKSQYKKSLDDGLPLLISYADKNDLIWGILSFDEILKKIIIGKDF